MLNCSPEEKKMPRVISIVMVFAVIVVLACFKGDESNARNTSEVTVDDLLGRAVVASPEGYLQLREEFLKSSHIQTLQKKELSNLAGWKEQVIAKAWIMWASNLKECKSLWNYDPPPNNYRNPFHIMAGVSYQRFKSAEETGLVIAQELMLTKQHILYGGLPDLLAEDGSEYSKEVILECAIKNSHHSLITALQSLGAQFAPRVHARLKDADRSCLPGLISVLAHFKYQEAMPELGELLLALNKEGFNDLYKFYFYKPEEQDIGLSIVDAFTSFSGHSFPIDIGSGKARAKRIDAAKEWWEQNAERYIKKMEKKTGEKTDAPDKK